MMTEASHIYPRIAEKYGLSIEQVRTIIIYFWRSGVKRSLENVHNGEIYINQLGSFKIKDWKLKYAIPNSNSFSQRTDVHEKTVEYFKQLNTKLVEIDQQIRDKRLKHKQFRESIRQNSTNIQGAQEDMGRPQEQADQKGGC